MGDSNSSKPHEAVTVIKHYDTQHNDTQQNDIQHYDIQHKELICDTRHKRHLAKRHPAKKTFSIIKLPKS
jgi:hypothetical protein